jgi:hypothetical protein
MGSERCDVKDLRDGEGLRRALHRASREQRIVGERAWASFDTTKDLHVEASVGITCVDEDRARKLVVAVAIS